MQYQLVLQWSVSSLEDFDALIEIECNLEEILGPQHEVDGHDMGMGEMNIFIHTNDPESTLTGIMNLLISKRRWNGVRIAYRKFSNEDYTVMWPADLISFHVQ